MELHNDGNSSAAWRARSSWRLLSAQSRQHLRDDHLHLLSQNNPPLINSPSLLYERSTKRQHLYYLDLVYIVAALLCTVCITGTVVGLVLADLVVPML